MIAALLLAVFAAGTWAPLVGAASRHCTPAADSGVAAAHHHGPGVSARGPHECGHCPAQGCSATGHCAAPAQAALPAAPVPLDISLAIALAPIRAGVRPLSANPILPTPPPQPVL